MKLRYCIQCALLFETDDTPQSTCSTCGRALVPYDGVLHAGDSDSADFDFDQSQDRTRVLDIVSAEETGRTQSLLETGRSNVASTTQVLRPEMTNNDGDGAVLDWQAQSGSVGDESTASVQELTQSMNRERVVEPEGHSTFVGEVVDSERTGGEATQITRLEEYDSASI